MTDFRKSYRLKVKCYYCKSAYSIVVYDLPQLRVERNSCVFCGHRVYPNHELPEKTIDTFIKPQNNNHA